MLQQYVTTAWERTETIEGGITKVQEVFDVLIENEKIKTFYIAERAIYQATDALKADVDIHKLALQMGTSVAMLEKFYSKVSPRMNAAEHAGVKKRDC